MYLRNFLAILSLVPALCCINDANAIAMKRRNISTSHSNSNTIAVQPKNILSSHHEDITNFNNMNICGSCTYMFDNGKIKFSKENKSEKEIKQILLRNKNMSGGPQMIMNTLNISSGSYSTQKSKIEANIANIKTSSLSCDDLYVHSNLLTLFSPDGAEYLKITGMSDDGILLNTRGQLRFNEVKGKFVPSGILNIMGKCSIKIMN